VVSPKTFRRGDIWLAALDPTISSEIQKTRPCLIVSPDSTNQFLRTVTALPMTTGSGPAGFRVPVTFQGTTGLLLGDQLRTLDKRRMIKRLGTVDQKTLHAALSVLREMFEE
jgi:mRNA interferase MazF